MAFSGTTATAYLPGTQAVQTEQGAILRRVRPRDAADSGGLGERARTALKRGGAIPALELQEELAHRQGLPNPKG